MNDKKTTSVSWARFGLRGLLLVVTITAIGLATVGNQIRRTRAQRATVRQLLKAGASVTYEPGYLQRRGPSVLGGVHSSTWSEYFEDWLFYFGGIDGAYEVDEVSVNLLADAKVWPNVQQLPGLNKLTIHASSVYEGKEVDAAWQEVAKCQQIEVLHVERTVNNPRIMALSQLPRLRALRIAFGDLDPDELNDIAKIPNLESLDLSLVGLTNDGLAELANMSRLRKLDIKHRGLSDTVTNDGIAFVASMTNLESLTLGRMPLLTDEVFQYIEPLVKLKSLNLDQSSITGEGIKQLAGLTRLTNLNLVGTNFSDKSMKDIVELRNLEILNLQGTPITDAETMHIGSLPRLKELNLFSTAIADTTIGYVKTLPELSILRLGKTSTTDAGLEHLIGHKTLKNIGVSETKVTNSAIARF